MPLNPHDQSVRVYAQAAGRVAVEPIEQVSRNGITATGTPRCLADRAQDLDVVGNGSRFETPGRFRAGELLFGVEQCVGAEQPVAVGPTAQLQRMGSDLVGFETA